MHRSVTVTSQIILRPVTTTATTAAVDLESSTADSLIALDMSSSSSVSPGANRMASLADEEMEPYVRKKRNMGESRSKMIGLNDEEQNLLRTSINSRERRRMHDLNDAHEELRNCLPYGQEANSRRLSKISTIMLASNWIRQLTKENQRLQKEVSELRRVVTSSVPSVTSVPTPAPTTTSSKDNFPVKISPSAPNNLSSNQRTAPMICEKAMLSVEQMENLVPKPLNSAPSSALNSAYVSAMTTTQLPTPGTVQAHTGPALVPILNFPLVHCLKLFGQPCLCIGCVSSGTPVSSSISGPNMKKESY